MNWHVFMDTALLDPSISSRICLTLLHSLWQLALLAAVVWLIEKLWFRQSVQRSYALHVAALFLGLVVLPVNYSVVGDAGVDREDASGGSVIAVETIGLSTPAIVGIQPQGIRENAPIANPQPTPTSRNTIAWQRITPWIAVVYAIGVVLMLVRLFAGIVQAEQLSSLAKPITDGPLLESLHALSRRWSMRVVPVLAQAEQIVVPKVVGLLKPTILLPVSAIAGLSMGEMEMILSHELAHVRRHDMWINLLQRLAEVVLFFNPALWYLSRRISILREYCCDEMACQAMSETDPEPKLRYATALLRVVELAKPGVASPSDLAALAASGRSPSELRRRVARLFGEPLREPVRVSRGGMWTLAAIVLLAVCGPTVWPTGAQTVDDSTSVEQPVTGDGKLVNLSVVVARHVLLLDGKEIITWPELEQKIAAMPNPSLTYPHLHITNGAHDSEGSNAAREEIGRLRKQFGFDRMSYTSLLPRAGFRYDGIKTAADLIPDENLRVEGQVVSKDGKPVEGAEVLLVTPVDESIRYKKCDITLIQGKLRNRLQEVVAISDNAGRFALYPPKDMEHYVVAMHPDAGFRLVQGDQFSDGGKVKLMPWGGLVCTFDEEPNEQQTACLTTRVRVEKGWPNIAFSQYWSDLKAKKKSSLFAYSHIPPMIDTTIQRNFRDDESDLSIGLPGASVRLYPGEVRHLNLGPLSEQQRIRLTEIRELQSPAR